MYQAGTDRQNEDPKPLTTEELDLWRQLEEEVGADALITRIPHVSGTDDYGRPFRPPWHVRPLAQVFADIRRGVRRRVTVGMPPRHSKTETLLNGVSWVWERWPIPVMYITMASDTAREKSRRAQQIAVNTGWKVKGTPRLWYTHHGASFRAVGVGGQVAGHGARLIIVDDPFKNREEAESKRYRDRIWDFLTDVGLTRGQADTSMIVLHHRWHDDDLIGRLKERPGWDHIRLPAIGADGKALWPEMFDLPTLEAIREQMGPYGWSSLYQQDPQPRGGRLFSGEPGRYAWPSPVEKCRFVLAACDPAATEDTHADQSAITIAAFYLVTPALGEPYVVMDVLWHWADHLEIPAVAQKLKWVSENWGCPIVVETIGAFKGVAQMLRKIAPKAKVIPIDSVKDKFTRSQHCASAWNNGKVRLPLVCANAPWLVDLLKQVRNFTGIGDAHDDRVDSMVHCWNAGYSALCQPRRGPGGMRHPGFA